MIQLWSLWFWRKASLYKSVVSESIPRSLFQMCVVGLLSLVLSQPCAAHFLNMTRGELIVNSSTGTVDLNLRVDFTRMLEDPIAYYELTQLSEDAAAEQRSQLIEALKKDLSVMADAQKLDFELVTFAFPDLPLEKFTEAWAAPMSELTLRADLPEGQHALKVQTNVWLRIEFPFVLTLVEYGGVGRPVTGSGN